MATCCRLASFVQAIGTDERNANEPASFACVYLCLCLFMLENSAFTVRLKWCAMSTTTELLVGSSVTNLQNNYISCFSAIKSNQIASFFNMVMHKFYYHRKVLRIDIHFFSTQVYCVLLQIVLSYS